METTYEKLIRRLKETDAPEAVTEFMLLQNEIEQKEFLHALDYVSELGGCFESLYKGFAAKIEADKAEAKDRN